MNFSLPATFRKIVVKKVTPVFKEAIEIVQQKLNRPAPKEVLIRTKFVGINASDTNASAGRYFSKNATTPFPIGFEGIGEVVDKGEKVSELNCGKPVLFMKMGAYSEYVYASEREVIPTASCDVNLLPLLVSGATAALSLDKCGHILPGDKVLITAAAGGAGHIAVQWAKNVGCHVAGLAGSSQNKVQFLKSIGCDRPINYKEESVAEVLRKEYPGGFNVIWETIGGETFDLLFKNLAVKGRMVIVGATSKYIEESQKQEVDQSLLFKLILRASSINGFFLPHFTKDVPHYLNLLIRQMYEQKLTLRVDDGSITGKQFNGLEDISRALDHIYSGKSMGKVIVPF